MTDLRSDFKYIEEKVNLEAKWLNLSSTELIPFKGKMDSLLLPPPTQSME